MDRVGNTRSARLRESQGVLQSMFTRRTPRETLRSLRLMEFEGKRVTSLAFGLPRENLTVTRSDTLPVVAVLH